MADMIIACLKQGHDYEHKVDHAVSGCEVGGPCRRCGYDPRTGLGRP